MKLSLKIDRANDAIHLESDLRTFFVLLLTIVALGRESHASDPPLPFKTLNLDEFNAKYTDEGRLYRGGRATKALDRIRKGRLLFEPGSTPELHCGANYWEINDQHGPYRNSVNAILPFSLISPSDKPFTAVVASELSKIDDLQTLLVARLGQKRASALKTRRDKLLALGIDAIVHNSYDGTIYSSHIVILNDTVIQVPTIARFMDETAKRYRSRSREDQLDFVANSLFSSYVYQYSLLTNEERKGVVSPKALAPSRSKEVDSMLNRHSSRTHRCSLFLVNDVDEVAEPPL